MTKKQATILALLERREARKRQRINRIALNIICVVGVAVSMTCLVRMDLRYMEAEKEKQSVMEESHTYIAMAQSAPERLTVHVENERPEAPVEVVEEIPVEPSEEYPEDFENEKIEQALTEQGYIREDIPMDNETQLLLRAACEETGIEYELALAVIWKETSFRNVMGDNGKAYGYFQVWPRWHGARMERLGVTDLNDPYGNFRVGCDYLAELIDAYDGNVEMALMAYNAGINGANKNWFSKGVYTNDYSQRVLAKYTELKGGE